MPPRKRKEPAEEDDEGATQFSQSSAAAASPLSPEETEKLANELCRYGACTTGRTQTPLAPLRAQPLAARARFPTHAVRQS